jgi:Kef-type K+ transport system membrane component KefB
MELSEQQESPSTVRGRVQRFGFMLCLFFVVIGILINILVLYSWHSYDSPVPMFISTMALCLAVGVGLLALMTKE